MKLKKETVVIVTKAFCVVISGFCLTLVAGLAQWATGGEFPNWIAWIVILSSAVGNAFDKLGSFLSTSFASFLKNGKTDDTVTPQKP